MTATAIESRLPVGRIVQGDLYKPQTTDQKGNPLTIKRGPRTGQATQRFFFAIAIPKGAGGDGGHWANAEWAKPIWNHGHASWPQGQAQNPNFAWKIEDGDSMVPNQRGRKNGETEGMPGHWIVSLQSSFAPKIVDASGSPILDPAAVKRGYWVEVFLSCKSNEEADKPGMYMNHQYVCLRGYGAEINSGPDPRTLGFGQSALPAGVSLQPVAGVPVAPPAGAPPPAAAAIRPPVPGAVGAPPPPAAAVPPPAATVVAPHTAYIAPPPPAAAVPPPPAAAAAGTWLGPAGSTLAQYLAGGWTEQACRENGLLR